MINKSNQILLHRFIRLGGRSDAQIFTFIVPSQITRGFISSALSKEFFYGGQQWQLNISSESLTTGESPCNPLRTICTGRPLSIGLSFCGALAGMKCDMEFIRFNVLNRESFHLNKMFEQKLFSFTSEKSTLWNTNWIQIDELIAEHFIFDDWTWLVELELHGANTVYEEILSIPKTPKEMSRCLLLESASFTFAGSDWSASLEWATTDFKKQSVTTLVRTKPEGGACPRLKLHRHSRTNHWYRVRYIATLVWGSFGKSTFGPVDQLITSDNGASTIGHEIGDPKWFSVYQQANFSPKQRIQIVVQMLVAAPVSRIDLIPIAPQGGKNMARCKDPDGYDWIVVSDILGSLVRLRFFPTIEIHHHLDIGESQKAMEALIPPTNERASELRCVSWNVHLIPFDTSKNVVKALSSPYVSYVPLYRCILNENTKTIGNADFSAGVTNISNDLKQLTIHPEEVTEVALDLPVDLVCDPNSGYIRPSDNAMTIRIEWLPSPTLHHGNYGIYDDLFQTQKKQLSRELKAMQMNNYALEKQLIMSGSQAHPQPQMYPNKFQQSQSQSLVSEGDALSQQVAIQQTNPVKPKSPCMRANSPRPSLQLANKEKSRLRDGRRHSCYVGDMEGAKSIGIAEEYEELTEQYLPISVGDNRNDGHVSEGNSGSPIGFLEVCRREDACYSDYSTPSRRSGSSWSPSSPVPGRLHHTTNSSIHYRNTSAHGGNKAFGR